MNLLCIWKDYKNVKQFMRILDPEMCVSFYFWNLLKFIY